MIRTLVVENCGDGRLRETNGRSKYIKIMVKRKCITKLPLAQVLLETVEICLCKVIELG